MRAKNICTLGRIWWPGTESNHLTGRTTRVTVETIPMARKRMFFSSEKAVRELGYRWRAAAKAFEGAVLWLR